MANPLFNRFGNTRMNGNNGVLNILNQYRQVQNDPGKILDILLNNGKINQQQYNDLQQYRNDPKSIAQYLINTGNASQINQAQQLVNQSLNY